MRSLNKNLTGLQKSADPPLIMHSTLLISCEDSCRSREPLHTRASMAVLHFSSAKELEYQLSPSRWNKRMGADAVIKDFLTKTKTGNVMNV